MALARSTVQVSIVSQLGQGFSAAFQTADARVVGLRKAVGDASRALSNIDAYRKQTDATKQAGYSWQAAKLKADEFRNAIAAQGVPTKKQTQELAKLERAAQKAGDKFGEQRTKLSDMGRELQKAGVNTGKLTSEYERLRASLQKAEAQQGKLEKSLERQQRIVQAMGGTWRGIASAAAGAAAGAAVLAGPTRKALSYDEQLSYMADTATGGDGQEAYKRNKTAISEAIDAALKGGGGKRDDAAAALNTMVASGKFTMQEALAQIKTVSKTAFAAGASADDIAKTAVSMKNFGITDLSGAFDQMMRAGQVGGFELRDMAKFLPQQLAYGKASGYAGSADLSKLLALNQAAMSTAGTSEEAGTNVLNTLQKFSSRELQERLAKSVSVQNGDPTAPGKKGKQAFDWAGYMMQQREKGVDPARAMTALIDRELAADKRYKDLQKRADASKDGSEEKKETLGAMSNILMGSKMGEFFTDRQAALGMLAALYQRDYMANVEKESNESKGIVDKSSSNIRGETWAKAVDAQNAMSRANEQTYNQLSGPMGRVLEFTTGLANEYPRLTTAAYGVTTGLTALAAALGAWGIAGRVLGGAAPAAVAAAAPAAAAAAGTSAVAGTAAAGGALATVAKLAGPVGMIAGVANMTTSDEDEELRTGRARKAALKAKYGEATIDAARKQHQPWYQVGEGFATDQERWVQQYTAGKQSVAGQPATPPGAQPQAAVQNPLADKVLESSTAAADAAKAASEAATTAQNRPNVTQNNNYQVTVQATQQDPAGIVALFDQKMRERDRQSNADLRASMIGQPSY